MTIDWSLCNAFIALYSDLLKFCFKFELFFFVFGNSIYIYIIKDYDNTHMQYTAIITDVKKCQFSDEKF